MTIPPQERVGAGAMALAVTTFTLPGMPMIHGMQKATCGQKLKFFEQDRIHRSQCRSEAFYAALIC